MAKAYATSWVLGGTTRTSEVLTIPTAGVLNTQEGTVECRFYYKPNGAFQCIVSFVGSALNGYRDLQFYITREGYVRFQPKRLADGTGAVYVLSASPITEGWHYAVCTWNQSEIKIAVDDQPVQKLSYGGGIATLDTYFTVGKEHNATFIYLNTLIDDLRISSRARTDAEIAAAYASGVTIDADTTFLMDTDRPFAQRAAKALVL